MSTLPDKNRFKVFGFWGIVIALFVLYSFAGKVVGLFVDFFWFKEISLTGIFFTSIKAKIACGGVAGLAAFIIIYSNLAIAKRLSGKQMVATSLNAQSVFAMVPNLDKILGIGLLVATVVVAGFIGLLGANQWDVALNYFKAVPFGSNDPLFNKDISFYVFTLPLYRAAFGSAVSVLVLSIIGTILVYFLRQNISVEGRLSITSSAQKHVLALVGIGIAMCWFFFQLKIYGSVLGGGHIVNGASYATISVLVPLYRALKWLSVLAAILIFMNMNRRGFKLALTGIAIVFLGNILAKTSASMVQKFIVAPNEVSKETPYINWSIASTRSAFNLDKIEEKQFVPTNTLTADIVGRNDRTTKNIRLWDQAPLLTTYGQLQEIRTYYEFLDVDNDRYQINSETRQVMFSPRELVPTSLPSRIWINEHLSYTHGYGLCMGPVNSVTPEGLPDFFIKNIPPVSQGVPSVTRPEIYYGEAPGSYVVVNTRAKEFDYPSGEDNVYTTYQGTGGVSMGGFFKKMLFVLHYKELKIFLSTDISPQSKIMYNRQILSRVRKAAPFLRFDSDPYIVVANDGRLVWIIDGFTTTSAYPYSQQIEGVGNYIRNSVKVTIDAYNGSLSFFVADSTDPLLATYSRIFPGVFKPLSDMPADVRSHIRYPQTLFTIQAQVYSTYHMTDPQVFYNKEDLWKISESFSDSDEGSMVPYYTIMKLAEVGTQEEFILMVPFSPAKKENMISWFAARCDEPNYGKLLVFNFPKQELIYGPKQIESRINQDAEISKQLTLWNQAGSRVIRGSLLVIPIEQALVFVQPLYLAASSGGVPELKRVIVAYGDRIVMEETLEESLNQIFGDRSASFANKPDMAVAPVLSVTTTASSNKLKSMISEASREFDKGQNCLTKKDFAGYGEAMNNVEKLIKEMAKQAE